MNQPSIVVRLAGSPLGGILLLTGCVIAVHTWAVGQAPWWWAFGGAVIGWKTITAFLQMQRYKNWRKQWDAIGQEGKEAEGRESASRISGAKTPRRWLRLLVAGLLALVFLSAHDLGLIEGYRSGEITLILFSCCVVYLVFGLGRWLFSALRRGGVKTPSLGTASEKPLAPPVTWLINRASFAPSRADAEKNLPEYSAKLLDSHADEHREPEPQYERQAAQYNAPPAPMFRPSPPTGQSDWLRLLSQAKPILAGAAAVVVLSVLVIAGLRLNSKPKWEQELSEAAKAPVENNGERKKPETPPVEDAEDSAKALEDLKTLLAERETENTGKVWTDAQTGLTWAGADNGRMVDWNEARAYCSELGLAGYQDWRLPSAPELGEVEDGPGHFKGGIIVKANVLWMDASKSGELAGVFFPAHEGRERWNVSSKTKSHAGALCVRGKVNLTSSR